VGRISEDANYFNAYIRNVITIATEVQEDNTLKIGFSFCSKKDQFEKKKGREIAIGRMNKNGFQVPFSGHSSEDVVKLWNESNLINKPQVWRNHTLRVTKHGIEFNRYEIE